MASVLLVEDSQVVMKVLQHVAKRLLNFDLVFATSRTEALEQIKQRDDWLAAIVDLNLPDAPNGELVDDVLNEGIPTIVLTGYIDDEKRDSFARRGIVDYVLKEGRYSYEYAVNLVNRLYRNQFIKVLVAEDSKVTRRYIAELLSRHLFKVVEVENGQQALDAIAADSSIKIVLTDYNMPELDGFELIRSLRNNLENMDMVIIGLSSAGDKYLSAKFIKNGANDFLYKPFSHEEFYCRIMQAVESMERLETMREMAYNDSLTGIPNRRYFVDKARQAIDDSNRNNKPLSLAIFDVDYFKSINDSYGHDVGDEVLVHFAELLKSSFERFLVARTGGEEFCVLMPGLDVQRAYQLLEIAREKAANEFVSASIGAVSYTVSIGVAQDQSATLEALMKASDEALYLAKDTGRNQTVIAD